MTTYLNAVRYQTLTIPAAGSVSNAVPVGAGAVIVGLAMPAAWDAANITYQGSVDGINFQDIYDTATNGTSNEWSTAAVANRLIMLDTSLSDSLQQIRLRSGTSATPVNQTAARTITLIIRDLA
jgi:hypothetical protein